MKRRIYTQPFLSQLRWDEEQEKVIAGIKSILSLQEITDIIHSLSRQKVLVVGEPIVDSYVFCEAAGISTKSPTVSARYLYQEDYTGGSLAIANHLAALGCEVELLITHGNEAYFLQLLEHMDPRIKIHKEVLQQMSTPRKTRYITPFRAQRIFELIEVKVDQWQHNDPDPFCQQIAKLSADRDAVLVADFGHGLFESKVLQQLAELDGFVGVNVQTNSDNFGFNPFTKHERYDYLSLDERECRVATHDRFTPIGELAAKAIMYISQRPTSITLGVEGSVFYSKPDEPHSCPPFFRDVVDTTGAGDAYFTITTLLVKMGVPSLLVPFLGNCYAGLKSRIIGNKAAVPKEDLLDTVGMILGT